MDEHSANADKIGGLRDPRERVMKEGLSETISLLTRVYRQARQQDDADGMIGQALRNSLGSFVLKNRTGDERVIANHTALPVSHVGLRRLGALIGPGETL